MKSIKYFLIKLVLEMSEIPVKHFSTFTPTSPPSGLLQTLSYLPTSSPSKAAPRSRQHQTQLIAQSLYEADLLLTAPELPIAQMVGGQQGKEMQFGFQKQGRVMQLSLNDYRKYDVIRGFMQDKIVANFMVENNRHL